MTMTVAFRQPGDRAAVSHDDRIFLGEGLFETIRVVYQQPCYAWLHWQRLRQSAQRLGIVFDLTYTDWLYHLQHSIELIGLTDGGVKVILSGGAAKRGLTARGNHPHLVFEAFPYQPSSTAVKLLTAPWHRDNHNPIYALKSVNYLEAILARRYAEEKKADDVVFFTFDGHATETTIANVFLIANDHLITPALTSGILPGIMRERIIHLCAQVAISCFETVVTRRMMIDAQGLFICNALQGIRCVSQFDTTTYSDDWPLINQLKAQLVSDRTAS